MSNESFPRASTNVRSTKEGAMNYEKPRWVLGWVELNALLKLLFGPLYSFDDLEIDEADVYADLCYGQA